MSGTILWLEPIGGAAGDMFLAAALDLGVDRAALEAALATLNVPGFRLEVTRAEAGGLAGTHLDVVVEGPQPRSRGVREILALVDASGLGARAKAGARAVFERLAVAEAHVHGGAPEEVHFHEVGAVDSIVDVCGAAIVLDLLGWPRVHAAAPELGQGFVRTEHGVLPVPPPAVLELLKGFPVRPGGPPGEAVTPTGAALLATFADHRPPPAFAPRRVGVGLGTRRWPDRPNALRMTLGDAAAPDVAAAPGEGAPLPVTSGMVELAVNLDDCPGQLVARAIEVALEAGAVDAWAAPVTMKKGRPGLVLQALAPAARRDAVARALLAETTTLGVRFRAVDRVELERALVEVETPWGAVRVKVGRLGGAAIVARAEYDDCLARAKAAGVPVKEVMAAAEAAWRSRAG